MLVFLFILIYLDLATSSGKTNLGSYFYYLGAALHTIQDSSCPTHATQIKPYQELRICLDGLRITSPHNWCLRFADDISTIYRFSGLPPDATSATFGPAYVDNKLLFEPRKGGGIIYLMGHVLQEFTVGAPYEPYIRIMRNLRNVWGLTQLDKVEEIMEKTAAHRTDQNEYTENGPSYGWPEVTAKDPALGELRI